jgi:flagellar hook assembly protein FlgD
VVETKLTGNYPNPFNPTTQINFSLAEAGDVELSIYNVRGQKVRTLVKEELPAMDHSILWNGTDDNDQSVSSGVYFYKLKTGDYRSTKKMLLIK